MEKRPRELMDEWLNFARTIKNMYFRLADLEINNQTETQEYKDIVSLLSDAKRYEDKRIKDLKLNKENFVNRRTYLTRYVDKAGLETATIPVDYLEYLRINNILEDMDLEYEFTKVENIEPSILGFITALSQEDTRKSDLYSDKFINICLRNNLAILNADLPKVTNKDVREYLIRFKYALIYTTPKYEELFIFMHGKILEPVKMSPLSFPVDSYPQEQVKSINYYNLKNEALSSIFSILNINDLTFYVRNDTVILSVRSLIYVKAILISLFDKAFIDEIKEEVDKKISESDLIHHSRALSCIEMLFDDAYNILNELTQEEVKLNKTNRKGDNNV